MSHTGGFYGPEYDDLDLPDMGEEARAIDLNDALGPQDDVRPVWPVEDEDAEE